MEVKEEIKRDYYKALFLGASGSGKTFAMRNLDPNTTGFIDYEDKPLPFPRQFMYRIRPSRLSGAFKATEEFIANPDIKLIIIDSISAYFDLVLEDSKSRFKGYDIWSNYNTEVAKMFKLIKSAQKEIFITGHYETLNVEGDPEKRAKVKGKEWEGVIEKEFTIVMYSDKKFKDSKGEYFFRLAGEGISAKVPPGIFKEDVNIIPNDYDFIHKQIVEFATIKQKNNA